MISRPAVIAALVLTEFAVVGAGVLAVRGGSTGAPSPSGGPRVAEGGPPQTFAAGLHPALTIDIGNADLTIRPGAASSFTVAATKSADFGPMRETAPIVAGSDGDALRVAVAHAHSWSAGDDRMVTVTVPPETRVTVTSAGDIVAGGLRAEASFDSDHGNVTIDDYDAPALHLTATGGTISLRNVAARALDVTGGDDRIEAFALVARDGRIESDGRQNVEFAAGTNAAVEATTSSGKIAVSGFDPSVALASDVARDESDDSASRSVRVGDGSGHLDLHTSDGNITVSRQ